jgi:hypothetical protein
MAYISEIWIFAYFRSNLAVGHMGFWHVSIPCYIFRNNSPRDSAAIRIRRSNSNFKLIAIDTYLFVRELVSVMYLALRYKFISWMRSFVCFRDLEEIMCNMRIIQVICFYYILY